VAQDKVEVRDPIQEPGSQFVELPGSTGKSRM